MPRPKKIKAPRPKSASANVAIDKVASYGHPESTTLLRPEIGAQTHFRKKKPPQKYRYDDSLSPELEWDGQNPARELGEWLLARIGEASRLPAPHQFEQPQQFGDVKVFGLADAVQALRTLGRPFLNWAGKAERFSFDVPTVPLFVHERLSTMAIIETLKGHKRDKQEDFLSGLFADPRQDLADQVTKAYEYPDKWVNRLMLGDSLVVMNSLLHYENLGGQVQMIYVDPPYGVKFGSNFQPFVRKRDVTHGEDEDMTREPEMVQAYRDTWELGLHSYLTYLRDRLRLSRDLLGPFGSIFVQISDENLHHVREVMDEVFGAENFCCQIDFQKTGGFAPKLLSSVYDYILWFAKDKERVKYRKLFRPRDPAMIESGYTWIQLENEERRRLTSKELNGEEPIPAGRRFQSSILVSAGASEAGSAPFLFNGIKFKPADGTHWKTSLDGLKRLAEMNRLIAVGNTLAYVRFEEDFPVTEFNNVWDDTTRSTFAAEKLYVVQTSEKVIQRCVLMTTGPGDLVLDPTCGSGTTAYVAEQWGRRWITTDTSRVPLALARQRLLTATFDYYELKDDQRGPAGGFVYRRKQNQKGEEVGGIVPHVTLKSIAKNEPPTEEVLVDRPEIVSKITRVCGPFVVEATIPTAEALDEEPEKPGIQSDQHASHIERMLEVLRRSPVLRLPSNQTVTLKNIRVPAQTLTLSAEAVVEVPSLDHCRRSGQRDEVARQRPTRCHPVRP